MHKAERLLCSSTVEHVMLVRMSGFDSRQRNYGSRASGITAGFPNGSRSSDLEFLCTQVRTNTCLVVFTTFPHQAPHFTRRQYDG